MPEEALKEDKSGINREQPARFIETRVECAESSCDFSYSLCASFSLSDLSDSLSLADSGVFRENVDDRAGSKTSKHNSTFMTEVPTFSTTLYSQSFRSPVRPPTFLTSFREVYGFVLRHLCQIRPMIKGINVYISTALQNDTVV